MESISNPNPEKFRRGIEEYEKREKRDAMYKVATFLVSHFWSKPSDIADGLGVLLLTWNQAFYRYGIFDFDKLEECITDNLQKIENFRKREITSLSNFDENDIKDLFAGFLEALQIDVMRFSNKNKRKYTKSDLEKILKELGIEFDGTENLKALYNSIKSSKMGDAVEFSNEDKIGAKKEYVEIRISNLGDKEREKLYSLDKWMKIIKRSPVSAVKVLHLLAPNFFPLWDDRIARAYECYYDVNPAEKYILFCKLTKTMADRVRHYSDRLDKTLLKLIDEYNYSYTQRWI